MLAKSAVVFWGGAALLVSCTNFRKSEPVLIRNSKFGPMVIAVAPALNLSGSVDFDAQRVADLMASELSYADGVSVIPVSRVLGVLAAQGERGVQSQSHALDIMGLLGADAILVFAVTEYDPYNPPTVGISAQLYGTWPGASSRALDPIALSRQAHDRPTVQTSSQRWLLAQTQRVFDASHESVVSGVRRFARQRGGEDSPYGWRKYVVSQRHFLRYCCHAVIEELLAAPRPPEAAGMEPSETGGI